MSALEFYFGNLIKLYQIDDRLAHEIFVAKRNAECTIPNTDNIVAVNQTIRRLVDEKEEIESAIQSVKRRAKKYLMPVEYEQFVARRLQYALGYNKHYTDHLQNREKVSPQ